MRNQTRLKPLPLRRRRTSRRRPLRRRLIKPRSPSKRISKLLSRRRQRKKLPASIKLRLIRKLSVKRPRLKK